MTRKKNIKRVDKEITLINGEKNVCVCVWRLRRYDLVFLNESFISKFICLKTFKNF